MVGPAWAVKDLSFPKGRPGLAFMTWGEVEREVARGGLDDREVGDLWDALWLDRDQVRELLAHVRGVAAPPFVAPMVVAAAFTGARRLELCRSRVGDRDLGGEEGRLRLPGGRLSVKVAAWQRGQAGIVAAKAVVVGIPMSLRKSLRPGHDRQGYELNTDLRSKQLFYRKIAASCLRAEAIDRSVMSTADLHISSTFTASATWPTVPGSIPPASQVVALATAQAMANRRIASGSSPRRRDETRPARRQSPEPIGLTGSIAGGVAR